MTGDTRGVFRLARLYNVQTDYTDLSGIRRHATPEALVAVLRAMGAPLDHHGDAEAAARAREYELWRRVVEPVMVAWDGAECATRLRLPEHVAGARTACTLLLEGGEAREWSVALADVQALDATELDGERFVEKRLAVPGGMPLGYHTLRLEIGGRTHESRIIAAPRQAPGFFGDGGPVREWGVFLPLYALRTGDGAGIGDYGDLARLAVWVGRAGGRVLGTLPLFAAFLDEPFDASPYSPASRLFWNPLYLDLEGAAAAADCHRARAILDSPEHRREMAALRDEPLIDYRRLARARRPVLDALAGCFFDGGGADTTEYARFIAENPRAIDFARFLAAGTRFGGPWPTWPAAQREGAIGPGDYDEHDARRHLYEQWLADRQLTAARRESEAVGVRLYLDLPLGVNPDGYDVWRERDSFALGVAAGAPPDPFFWRGQDWGFPPLNPEALRASGYRYFAEVIRTMVRRAGVIRLDHVMGLHRLFWVPAGFDATQGVYVRYRPEEFYAVLTLESHREGAVVVGEDLGTVPQEVREAMHRHRIHRMSVVQFEVTADMERPLPDPPADAVTTLNTHDMPTFRSFWEGLDIADRQELGLLDEAQAREAADHRKRVRRAVTAMLRREGQLGDDESTHAVLGALLAHLAATPAAVLLLNLEDLWLETKAQNVPGTTHERPNWRRRARYDLEEIPTLPEVAGIVQRIHALRQRGKSDG